MPRDQLEDIEFSMIRDISRDISDLVLFDELGYYQQERAGMRKKGDKNKKVSKTFGKVYKNKKLVFAQLREE